MKNVLKIIGLSLLLIALTASSLTAPKTPQLVESHNDTGQQTTISSALFFDFDTASRNESRVDFQNNLPTSTLKLQYENHEALIRFREQQVLSQFCQYAFYSFDFTLSRHRSLLLFPFHDFF